MGGEVAFRVSRRALPQVLQLSAPDANGAALRVIEALQQLNDCGLTAPRGAHEGNRLALRNGEADVLQYPDLSRGVLSCVPYLSKSCLQNSAVVYGDLHAGYRFRTVFLSSCRCLRSSLPRQGQLLVCEPRPSW